MSAEKQPPPPPLPLRKPPGYRDPNAQIHHHPLPSHHSNRRRRGCCRICCCCFSVVIVILILVAASAALTFYLLFQPRLPVIHLKSIEFTKFNVTTAPDGPVVDAASTVAIEIRNPNQVLGFNYERSDVSVSAVNGDVSLGEQTVAGFSQDKDTVTRLKLPLKVEREIVDGRSEEELKKGLKNKKLLLNAEIRSGIGIKHRRWSTAPIKVRILCNGMRLRVADSTPKCRIKVLNW